ncbi:MAG: leucine-rich repeat protein, partial [Eubacterium sp.]|nr:leucine-rich repeat protein [Eubacterium sp.]
MKNKMKEVARQQLACAVKKVLSLLLTIVILFSITAGIDLSVYATTSNDYVYGDGSLSRAQWFHNLAVAFDMYDETEYFENYFSDLNKEHQYFDDILLNIKYGTIEIEAGGELKPDDKATKEFAVHSLNKLLGIVNQSDYSFSDSSLCNYPDDAQVAIDEGWIELSSGKFNPDSNLTSDEAKRMLESAEEIHVGVSVDENYDSNWNLAKNIIEVPETANVSIDENSVVSIIDSPINISTGDNFVVYQGSMAYPYTAKSVTVSGKTTTIETTALPYDNAFESVDAQGVIDSDNIVFESVLDGLEIIEEDENDTLSTYSLSSSIYKPITATKKRININSKSVKIGSATLSTTGNLNNVSATFDYNTKNKKASIIVNFIMDATVKISGSINRSVPLISISLGDIAGGTISIKASANGSVSQRIHSNVTMGFEFSNGRARPISSFSEAGGSYVQTQVEVKAGINVNLGLKENKIISGNVFAEMGFKADRTSRKHSDGSTPVTCTTEKSCFYIQYGANASCIFIKESLGKTVNYYDYDNSPVRSFHHYEDGKEVASCRRGNDFRYYTRWNSAYWGIGFNTCSGYGLDDVGELVPIYTYSLNNKNEATITGYKGNSSYLNIPEEIDGYTVIGIGASVFKNHKELSGVNIPDTVISIGNYAFQNTGLTCLELPANLTTLGSYVLSGNTGVKEIIIPKTLKNASFAMTTGYPGPFGNSGIEKATFENGMTKIPGAIFSGSEKLREVNIPNTVTSIECNSVSGAFMGCISLTQISIPNSVTEIGNYAFENSGLTSLKLPSNLTTLGSYVLSGNTGVKEIIIPKTLKNASFAMTTGYPGPFGNSGIEKATFENGMTKIPGAIFSGSEKLREVNIPNTVTSIECNSVSGAFMGCISLTQINIPNSVTEIGNYAFENSGLISINLPDSITGIGNGMFSGCSNLRTVKLPNTRQNISENMFYGCTSLESINLPDTVRYIKKSAFENSGLKTIKLSANVELIEASAFKNSALESITFSGKEASIGNNAFQNCDDLKSISVPDSVTSIGTYIFQDCDSLSDVKLGTGITRIPSYAFEHCDSLSTIAIPYKASTIEKNAFSNCIVLTEVTIPKATNSIDATVFSYPFQMTIKGVSGTYAETFAKENDIKFIALEKECNHIWDNGEVTKVATCTTTGVKTYTCTVCGETKTETIKSAGHKAVTDKAIAATCTTAGKTAGSHCSVCNAVIIAQKAVPATGHSYDSGKITKKSTCTATGVKTYTCTKCKATKTETIKATGHKAVIDKAVAATCTKAGKTAGSHCSVCNTVITVQKTVPATGHKAVTDKAVAATCTTAGKTAGSHCSVCNAVITAQKAVPATEHSYDAGKVTKQPTVTTTGVKTYTCTKCKATKTEAIKATGLKTPTL